MSQTPKHPIKRERFAVQIHFGSCTTEADEAAFQERLEHWLEERSIQVFGIRTLFALEADRDMTVNDQVDLLLAMLCDHAVQRVRVGPLHNERRYVEWVVSRFLWVEADQNDLLVNAALLLLDAGRLDAPGFISALGGYVCRSEEPLEFVP